MDNPELNNKGGSKEDENNEIELEGTGYNEESTPDENEEIVSPFDPRHIKISIEPKTIDSLVARIRHAEIDMNPEFQRRGNLWPTTTQSRLIESLLLKFPLPAFYFDASDDDNWIVVDGLQRLWTLKNFIIDQTLILHGLEILKDYNDKIFDTLNLNLRRRILETQVITYLIQPGTPKIVKYNVFRRINTGGLVLNSQEIRHALNQKQAAQFLKSITENSNFSQFFKIRNKRMEDCELVLRGLSFIFRDYNEYQKPLSEFLDKSMELIENMESLELNNLKESFFLGLTRSRNLFGKFVFSRSIAPNFRYRLNAALFEVWVSSLAKMSSEKYEILCKNSEILFEDYKKIIINDTEFERAVVSSTSGKNSVLNRFSKIEKLILQHT